MEQTADESAVADRLVVTYRAAETDGEDHAELSDNSLVHQRIQDHKFTTYLRRVHGGPVAEDDEWSEFVNTGCGMTTDVVLRVEALSGGTVLTEETDVELVAADALETESPA